MATKTFEELKQLAIQIRDEKTNKQNTATRVGTAMLEHINKLEQDYYDKTQTDEELKERDDKLTELDSNLQKRINVCIGISWKKGFYLNNLGEEKVDERYSVSDKILILGSDGTELATNINSQGGGNCVFLDTEAVSK